MASNAYEPSAKEKVRICRVIHFFREYLGISLKEALEWINQSRTPDVQIGFDAASNWYIWFAIGRREFQDRNQLPPVPAIQNDVTTTGLVNALIYEANLKAELAVLKRSHATKQFNNLDDVALQVAALEEAIQDVNVLARHYWEARAKNS